MLNVIGIIQIEMQIASRPPRTDQGGRRFLPDRTWDCCPGSPPLFAGCCGLQQPSASVGGLLRELMPHRLRRRWKPVSPLNQCSGVSELGRERKPCWALAHCWTERVGTHKHLCSALHQSKPRVSLIYVKIHQKL